MNILVTGAMTYLTRQFVKQLVDSGHQLRYRGTEAAMPLDPSEHDWLIRGVTAYPQQHIGGQPISLPMASKQLHVQSKTALSGVL